MTNITTTMSLSRVNWDVNRKHAKLRELINWSEHIAIFKYSPQKHKIQMTTGKHTGDITYTF